MATFTIIFSILIFIISIIAMHYLIGVLNIFRLTIPGAFYLTYLIMIFFPSFYVYLDHPGEARDVFMIGVVSVLITVPLGIILVNYLYNFKKSEIETYFVSPASIQSTRNVFPAIFCLAAFTVLMTLYYFYSIPSIPIIELIQGSDPLSLAISREEAFKLLDPRWGGTYLFYFYLFNRTLVFPVLILLTLGYFLYTRKKKWLYLFIIVFCIGGFYAVSQLSRAPIAAIVMRILIFLLLFYRGDVNLRKLIFAALLMLSYPLVVTMSYVTDRTILDGILAILIRLTYTPAEDLYYYFEIFPMHHSYLYGETLIKPFLKLFELDYFYIENYVAQYISPGGLSSAHANAAFVSNFHADFGLPGVFIGGLITAMMIQWIQIKLLRWEKSIYNMSIFAVLVYSIWALNFGSITSVLLVNGVIPVFILIFCLKFLTAIFNLYKPKKLEEAPVR
jgi:oligosaccharide repeat unit polymerase